jgi:hypothetical protein
VLHASPAGQSVATLQPHVPLDSHAEPLALPTQLVHEPLTPQAPGALPGAHVPPLQQPPLHAVCPAPHAVLHVCVVVLQALPVGQSVAALQPHVGVAPVSHTCPIGFPVQSAQMPAAPHAFDAVPATHWVPLQHPALHAVWPALPHVVLQVCVVVLQESPVGQSDAALQPHARVDAMHTDPAAFPWQLTQAPDPPHAVLLVPGWHELPDPQHPAVQGEAGSEHEKVQRSVVVLQPALFAGQLALVAHPHCPPPVTTSQALPLVPAVKPAVQLAQRPPLFPQDAVSVPTWHVPPVAAEQQPPLQGCDVLQLVVHVLVVVSHASSAGQSAAVRQPHAFDGVPTTHAEPLALPVHDAHVAWPVLQVVAAVPALHDPLVVQQPPLHAVSCGAPHAVVHCPATVSHAMSLGQSVALTQEGPSGGASTPASMPASTPTSVASSAASASWAPASTMAASAPVSKSNDASKVVPSTEKLASFDVLFVEPPKLQPAAAVTIERPIAAAMGPPHTNPCPMGVHIAERCRRASRSLPGRYLVRRSTALPLVKYTSVASTAMAPSGSVGAAGTRSSGAALPSFLALCTPAFDVQYTYVASRAYALSSPTQEGSKPFTTVAAAATAALLSTRTRRLPAVQYT